MLRYRSATRDALLRDTFAVIMAGGEGNRLGDLTRSESKPALPIAGHYRNIDFPLSNCVNSGIRRIGLLTQYKAHSLIQHVQRGWSLLRPELGECLELWPAQQRAGKNWYLGTADAVRQNIDIIDDHDPRYVLVLAGDHIYAMDYLPMLEAHVRARAVATIGCVQIPLAEARAFGVLGTDQDGRVGEFYEKPASPRGTPERPDYALGSMGIYVFDYAVLRKVLTDTQAMDAQHDFGRDVVPTLVENAHVQAYEFLDRESGAPGYWRDVGTLDSYWKANMELLEDPPPLDLTDESWPILTSRYQSAPARISRGSAVTDSIVGSGCKVAGAVTHSVLSENAEVHAGSNVEHSVLLPGAVVGRNCSIRNAVIDSKCRVPDGTSIGDPLGWHGTRADSDNGISLVTTESFATRGADAATRQDVA